MKKWILAGIALLVAAVAALVIVAVMNIGAIIKKAVETIGPRITKTEVRLAEADVSMSGEGVLKGLVLGNPAGFKSKTAFEVDEISIKVDKGSLATDTIVIERIVVLAPKVTYEKSASGDNFQAILNNIKKATSDNGKPGEAAKDRESGGKKLIIRDLIIKDGRVNLAVTALGGEMAGASLPEIRLKDIGEDKKGATPAEVFEKVFAALHKDVLTSATSIAGDAGKAVEQGLDTVTGKVKGLFGN
ncbi:MAG: hypothetical protein JW718_10735 [Desulfovibrionaceae bacterium]|nr:hypothetical protein [Desulfovibrionaceae bacterium]